MTLSNSCRYSALLFSIMTVTTNAFMTPSVRKIHQADTTTTTQLHFFNFGKKPEEKEQVVEMPKKEEKPAPEEEDLDPIEKLFSFFFGKPEEEPFGLKRFGAARFPEQYPATVDEWAEPLEGDSPDVAKLRPLLKNTNMEFRGLTLSYDANKNGWNAEKFHQAVDRKGGALVVCTTQTGQVCGYVTLSFAWTRNIVVIVVSESKFRPCLVFLTSSSFFSFSQKEGPSFGADSLVIPLGKGNPKMARSKLGSYYERFEDGTNSLFGKGRAAVLLTDLKVYHGVYAEGEYIPFTDAEPFALY
eukprot:scaffold640_cov166-Amphora_coffeaeformis.AAC.6